MRDLAYRRDMSIFAYCRQIVAHRSRVRRLGCALSDHATWGRALRVACLVHDAEKWIFLPLLLRYRCGRGDRVVARRVYDAMNAVGRIIQSIALAPFSRRDCRLARRLERIIDVVDRHMDPVARTELGDDGPPLSSFLSRRECETASLVCEVWTDVFGRMPE